MMCSDLKGKKVMTTEDEKPEEREVGVFNDNGQNTAEDEKPEELPSHVSLIKVVGQDESVVFFRLKRTVELGVFMEAYCKHRSVEPGTIVFLFDGKGLKPRQTPQQVGLEDGDEIHAMLHGDGGGKTT